MVSISFLSAAVAEATMIRGIGTSVFHRVSAACKFFVLLSPIPCLSSKMPWSELGTIGVTSAKFWEVEFGT